MIEKKTPRAKGVFGTFWSLCYEVLSEPRANTPGFLEKIFGNLVSLSVDYKEENEALGTRCSLLSRSSCPWACHGHASVVGSTTLHMTIGLEPCFAPQIHHDQCPPHAQDRSQTGTLLQFLDMGTPHAVWSIK